MYTNHTCTNLFKIGQSTIAVKINLSITLPSQRYISMHTSMTWQTSFVNSKYILKTNL